MSALVRSVILDLSGDPSWSALALAQGAHYVLLAGTDFWRTRPDDTLVIVDGRRHYEQSLELIARLAPSSAGCTRVLVTERESARDHERAYRCGTTRIVLMAPGEITHADVLAQATATGTRS
jgi:hypothetical protein